jgi:polysaccharide export outer membrane protein
MGKTGRFGILRACLLGSVGLLSACASLPSSGPTAKQVIRGADASKAPFAFRIVDLDPGAAAHLEALSSMPMPSGDLGRLAGSGRTDLIGPGDVLEVAIYEVGVSLFSRSGNGGAATFDPSAHGEKFPPLAVDKDGNIRLPYVGSLKVSGLAPAEVERQINIALRSKSQSPQAVVSVTGNVTNAAYVSGSVRRPGKYDLTAGGKHLLNAIAEAGGSESSPEDTIVQFTRRGQTVGEHLQDIVPGSAEDLMLEPGDRIQLLKRQRTFTVFGATGHVSQMPFEANQISLAEALARATGPSDATADPSAIFLFRQNPGPMAEDQRRVIYRLNMLEPASYFIAQNFVIQDKDLIYIANARANQPSKFISILNQLFSPFLTVRALTQ